MNKYYQMLGKVLNSDKTQQNKKGGIRYLLNEHITLLCRPLGYIREPRHSQKEVAK